MADTQVLVDDEFRKWQCEFVEKRSINLSSAEVQLNGAVAEANVELRLRRQFGPFQCLLRLAMMNGSHGLGVTLSDGAIEALIDIGTGHGKV